MAHQAKTPTIASAHAYADALIARKGAEKALPILKRTVLIWQGVGEIQLANTYREIVRKLEDADDKAAYDAAKSAAETN